MAEGNCGEWTFAERFDLSVQVLNVPNHEQPNIYNIVFALDREALEDCEDDPNSAYVLFHVMTPEALQQVQNYVLSRPRPEMETHSSGSEDSTDDEQGDPTAESSAPAAESSAPAAESSAPAASGASSAAAAERSALSTSTENNKGETSGGAAAAKENTSGGAAADRESIKSRLRKASSPNLKSRLRKSSKKSIDGSSK